MENICIQVSLPREVVEYIDKQARSSGRTRSNDARQFILQHLTASGQMRWDEEKCKWVEVKI